MNSIHQNFIGHKKRLEQELGEDITISGLVGPLRIFQRECGHRHSIDDAMTAWYALQKCPDANSILDLGTGIGSVGLAVLWGLSSEATLTCIEAQEISYKLLRANIECNNMDGRVCSLFGDIRTLNLNRKFPLITGSPPYFPANAGIIPTDSQKAHARFELRGNLSDYARVAKDHLQEDGVFVYCFPFQQKKRGIKLLQESGLKIESIRDVLPSRSKPALFSLYAARLKTVSDTIEEPAFIVADDDGKYSAQMLEVQRSRGFGPEGTNLLE